MKKIAIIGFLLLGLAGGMQAQAQLFKQPEKEKSTSIVTIAGEQFYVHSVRQGETVYSLSKLYDVTEEAIVRNNPQAVAVLSIGQVLKIPVAQPKKELKPRQVNRLFTIHTVNKGETASSISRFYGIAIPTMVEDNPGLDPNILSIGQQIRIRKESMGEATDSEIQQQWTDYKEALNSLSDNFEHHMVERGETIYSLSRQYDISEEDLRRYNATVLENGLKAGTIIKIPARHVPETVAEQPDTTVRPDEHDTFVPQNTQVKAINPSHTLNVAMLLPFQNNARQDKGFVEFYQGALLALEDLKTSGTSVQLTLYSTGRSADETRQIVRSDGFDRTDLIIGPVYEECLEPVLRFADGHGVPVVSPLADMPRTNAPLLYQVAPPDRAKADKIRKILAPEKNIIVVRGGTADTEFEQEIIPLLPSGYKQLSYTRGMPTSTIENILSGDKENVFVLLPANENTVEEILARISSVQNNLIARSIKNPAIQVLGTSQWSRFRNIDKTLYFKLNLAYVTSYHADRSDPRVMSFDKRYIAAFGAIPTLYAYRGYDVAKLFARAMTRAGAGSLTDELNHTDPALLLQTPYCFQGAATEKKVNTEWALVQYKNDFTIEVR
ncbi:MAG: LysM peptidoglycan-binding domain-containing protein [Rikenellaceae bacterium]|nr:LysM peptidoglycan-binding domain-containing protein [Rikenellaceae bacterium]